MKILVAIIVFGCAFADAQEKRVRRAIREEDAIRYVQMGANADKVDALGKTPMHFAAEQGWQRFAQVLIDRGHSRQIHVKDKNGDTPLFWAVSRGHENVAKLLIDNRADLEAKNNLGRTPLHSAVLNARERIVRMLLDRGASQQSVDNSGKSPRDYAVQQNLQSIIRMFGPTNPFPVTSPPPTRPPAGKPTVTRSQTIINDECGKHQALPSDYIINGTPADKGEFPWQVSLGYRNPQTLQIDYNCGGTIISKRFILTAAHCVKAGALPVQVRMGDINLNSNDAQIQSIEPQNIIRHKEYSQKFKKNDIALIRLSQDIYFSSDVRAACLETDIKDAEPNEIVYVTGYGITSTDSNKQSDELLKAQLRTVPLKECNQTFLEYNQGPNLPAFRDGISQSQMCAFDRNGADTYQGDSGGPVQIFRDPYTAHVVGIVSFGVSCGLALPGINTRVAAYSDWIAQHVWPNK